MLTTERVAGARPDDTGTPSRAPNDAALSRRRRALPTGRAAAGGLLIGLAVLGVLTAWMAADRGPATQFAVVTHDVRAGERIDPGDVELRAMELPPELTTRAFVDLTELEGATTLTPLAAGELVQASAVIDLGDTSPGRELSFPIESDLALAGTLRPGERVDVLATIGSGGDARTEIVAARVPVIDVAGGGDDLGTGLTVVTVGVRSDEEAIALAHAIRSGELVLVRATGSQGAAS